MKKYFLYIALFLFVFTSCDKFPPLSSRAGLEDSNNPNDSDSSAQDDNKDDKSDKNPEDDGDLDVITDPNNDEDYDGERKKPVIITSSN